MIGISIDDDEIKEKPEILNPLLDLEATTLDKIEEFGKLKYSRERIAAALGYTNTRREELFRKLDDPTSEERIAYEQGSVMGDAEIEIGLAEKAKSGDNFCAEELLKRQDHRRLDELRKDLFGI